MKLNTLYACIILFFLALSSCKGKTNKTVIVIDTVPRRAEPTPWPASDSLDYIALKDSAKLVHIKNQFYRSKDGRLFDKMDAPKKPDDIDTGLITFFRITDQSIDPLTFEVIDGSWFARDKNFVYNYRPNDAGMVCIKMAKANVKYFKLLRDNGGIYGADNKHVFEEDEIIENLDPLNMQVIIDKDRRLKKIVSGRYELNMDSGANTAVLIKPGTKHKRKAE